MLGASGSLGRGADRATTLNVIFPLILRTSVSIAVLFNVFGFLFVKASKFGPGIAIR
jgi:hypothetical protein